MSILSFLIFYLIWISMIVVALGCIFSLAQGRRTRRVAVPIESRNRSRSKAS